MEQVEGLEDEAGGSPAEEVAGMAAEGVDRLSIDFDRSLLGVEESGDELEECRLSRAGGGRQERLLAGGDFQQADVNDLGARRGVPKAQVGDAERWGHG